MTGEIRVVGNKHIRMTWQEPPTLQIWVIPKSEEKVTISFHQEKILNQELHEEMRTRWKSFLRELF